MKKLFTLLLILSISTVYIAQETAISNNPITTCEGFIVDTGLTAGDGGANENFTQVICSDSDTIINLFFNLFSLGTGDTLSIYDGSDTDAPLIGTYATYDLGQQNITSSNPIGCLTLVWSTDGEDASNFTAEMSCEAPCIPPLLSVTTNDADTAHVIYSCPGQEVLFDASGTVFADGALLESFEWDFSDGDIDTESWPIATHTFNDPGGYLISLNVLDDNECASNNVIDIVVLVSTYPEFVQPEIIEFCVGEGELVVEGEVDVLINGSIFEYGVNATPFDFNFGGLGGDSLFIPDDQTTCFESSVEVAGFNPGATIEDVDLIENLFINFEHSFMGDLTITFICPNNQNIAVHQQGGGGTQLGVPDQGDGTGPGDGWDYWWAPDAELGTWADESGGTLASGTYSSVQGFESLVGCPINGVWTVQICDSWGADDGYIFDWHIEFDSTLYPSWVDIIPIYGLNCDSTYFSSQYFSQDPEDCSIVWNEPVTEAGSFPVTITTTNDFGCVFTDDIEYFVFDDPIAEAGENMSFCLEGSEVQLNGSSTFEFSELGEYSYNWSPPFFIDNDSILNPILNEDAVGELTYFLTVMPTDHPACASTDSVTVTIAPTPDPIIIPDGPIIICANGEVGLSVADVYEGVEWDGDASLNTNSITAAPGLHTVVVYVDENCPVSTDIQIDALPQADFVDNTSCYPLNQSLVYFIEGDAAEIVPGEWTFLSDDGTLTFNSNSSSAFATASDPGSYDLTFTDNCGFSDDITVTYNIPPTEEQFVIDPEYVICAEDTPFLIQPEGDDFGSYSFLWSNGVTGSTTSVIATGELGESGIEDVMVQYTYTATNICGSNEDTTFVTIIPCELNIPNIFTPNSIDTLNSSFVVSGLHFFEGSVLTVFNRWGNIVYESSNYKNDWSPTIEDAADGTYYYILNVKRRDNSFDDYSGYVQILR